MACRIQYNERADLDWRSKARLRLRSQRVRRVRGSEHASSARAATGRMRCLRFRAVTDITPLFGELVELAEPSLNLFLKRL